jgi:hypothetical protein
VETEAGSWGREVIWTAMPEYRARIATRTSILEQDPGRYCMPDHMRWAGWDTLLWVMEQLAQDCPEHFEFSSDGEHFVWKNRALGIEQAFRYGDASTLPLEPLDFIGRQITEDLVLLDQRDGRLWAEAGLVTFPHHWSVRFVQGMSFQEIHGPIPTAASGGDVFQRVERFLVRTEPGDAFRRVNFTFQLGSNLDFSFEAQGRRAAHGLDAGKLEDAGSLIHLRTEIQHLVRLPRTGAILFLITTRLLPLEKLVSVPEWSRRTLAVLEELPEEIWEYKGLAAIADLLLPYLRNATSCHGLRTRTARSTSARRACAGRPA